jgi:hypothetical protein
LAETGSGKKNPTTSRRITACTVVCRHDTLQDTKMQRALEQN